MEEAKLLKRKTKAQNDGNTSLETSACIALAEFYFRNGQYLDAISEYKIIAQIYRDDDKTMDYARCNRMIGEAYTHLREYLQALKHQQIHLSVAKELGDKLEEQRALATLGHIYLTKYLDVVDNPDKSALDLASAAFKKSLAICESLNGIGKIEKMDMMARLFANMGVVKESQGNYEDGIKLMEKSITICKSNDIYEQLERGYSILGSLYCRKESYREASQYYNKAIEVAGRLEEKVSLTCASLLAKADILIKLADFHGAKNVLFKAYKLKTPNIIEKELIENNLKIVYAMCSTEDSLLLTTDLDFGTKKALYEKMGDGASELKNYSKAIEYYKKMLENSELNGDSEKDLSTCYASLAQTYNDNKEYALAIEYFKKDYAICRKSNLRESINTLYSIIEAMEASGKRVDDMIEIFKQALADCRKQKDKHMEGKTLYKYILVLKKDNRLYEANKLQMEFDDLNYLTSECESEGNDTTQNIGKDIDLDDITDCSDEEMNVGKPRTTRTRPKTFDIKTNEKGETPLHKACIKGNIALVQRLLLQGHTVNVRDNCGWLPIHEACSWGHLEIAKLLFEHGAAINDRGGVKCEGMTPLHDAAANGHLEVIEFLLDSGASVVAKNDNGDTAFNMLRQWRTSSENLDSIEQSFYETIYSRMVKALEKVGQTIDHVATASSSIKALVMEYDHGSTSRIPRKRTGDFNRSARDDSSVDCVEVEHANNSNNIQKSKPKIGDLRRNTIIDCWDSDECEYEDHDATDEYKNIMENLRKRSHENTKKRKLSDESKRPALLTSYDAGDDWLEDDIGESSSKKRKPVNNTFTSTMTLKTHTSNSTITDKENLNDMNILDYDLPVINNKLKNKRKTQSTLIKAGFTKHRSISPQTTQNKAMNSQSKITTQSKLLINKPLVVEATSTTDVGNSKPNKQIFSVDVKIESKLFRIPIPYEEMETLTMKWLAEEATQRFYRKVAMKPVIELETKNGAMLGEDDLIRILFTGSNTHGEEVQGRVIKWNTPGIIERYKDACACINMDTRKEIMEALAVSTVTLNVSNANLRNDLFPLCKALSRHTALYELNLSGNYISNRSMELLCESFTTLDSLAILNLSINNLTAQSLNYISTALTESNTPLLTNLIELDLSFNPLKNNSYTHLAVLTKFFKLKTLNLISVDFTRDIFETNFNQNLELYLDFLVNFDISFNELSKRDLIKLLSFLNPENIIRLNIGNNNVTEAGLANKIVNFTKLTHLDLSMCHINDENINDVLSVLVTAEQFEEFILASNQITSLSLRRILENIPLNSLDVSFCNNITKNFEFDEIWRLNKDKKCTILKTTLDYIDNRNECDWLIDLWRGEYKELADVQGISEGVLDLCISDYS